MDPTNRGMLSGKLIKCGYHLVGFSSFKSHSSSAFGWSSLPSNSYFIKYLSGVGDYHYQKGYSVVSISIITRTRTSSVSVHYSLKELSDKRKKRKF